jgi:hypothetical protein
VTEKELSEIERVLLYVGDARARAERAAAALGRAGAPVAAVSALNDTAARMADAYRTLTQRAYYGVASDRRS